jgi:aspartyl protease family protein
MTAILAGFDMRQILVLAAIILAGGTYAARFVDLTVMHPAEQVAAATPVVTPPEISASPHSLTLDADRRGYFQVDARVDGRHLDFIVDTGASVVALRESDAAELGIHPMPADYTATVSTANGNIKAARAKLDRIEVGDITVFDVAALVLPDEALSQNLLGVTFLSRLRRYEYANGRLVLEQ